MSLRESAKRAGRFLRTSAALLGIWLLLSGKVDALHVGAGAVSAIAVAAVALPRDSRGFPVRRFAAYLPWLLWQVLLSNLRVAALVLSPRSRLAPRIVRADPGTADPRALTLLGCSITLTPGTVTIDIGREGMTVHALDPESAREIEEGVFARRAAAVFDGGGP